jgi:hypothetical protein
MLNFNFKLTLFWLYNTIAMFIAMVIIFYATFFTLIGVYNFKNTEEIVDACLGKGAIAIAIAAVLILLLLLINWLYLKALVNKSDTLLKKTMLVEALTLFLFVVLVNYINYKSLLTRFLEIQ